MQQLFDGPVFYNLFNACPVVSLIPNLVQVSVGLPLFLFPVGVHLIASLWMETWCILLYIVIYSIEGLHVLKSSFSVSLACFSVYPISSALALLFTFLSYFSLILLTLFFLLLCVVRDPFFLPFHWTVYLWSII